MKMHKLFAFAGMILLAAFLAGCDDHKGGGDTNKEPPAATAPTENLTPTTMFRDATKDNGETLRLIYKTDAGIVRKIEIDYDGKAGLEQGIVVKDDNGKPVSLKMALTDHTTIEGIVSPDGTTFAQANQYYSNGKLMVKRVVNGTTTRVEGYQRDGVTLSYVSQSTAGGDTNYTGYQADGKTLAFEQVSSSTGDRKSLKIYDENGKLKLDDARGATDPNASPTGWGWNAGQTFIDTVYNAQGNKTHRVTIQEGTYDSGGGRMTKIEEFDTDGVTVKNTITLQYYGEPPHQIGVFANQDLLIGARKDVWVTVTFCDQNGKQIDTVLNRLLHA